MTPGPNDLSHLFSVSGISDDLHGAHVLDIGASNGGTSFECERRGAERIVSVDAAPSGDCGLTHTRDFLGSKVEYVNANVYELPSIVNGQFDLVIFWGVLYHLRHPLMAVDNIWRVCRGYASIETAVFDDGGAPSMRFYPRDELNGDGSNWFVPNIAALCGMFDASGFSSEIRSVWPESAPERCMMHAKRLTDRGFVAHAYESALSVRIDY